MATEFLSWLSTASDLYNEYFFYLILHNMELQNIQSELPPQVVSPDFLDTIMFTSDLNNYSPELIEIENDMRKAVKDMTEHAKLCPPEYWNNPHNPYLKVLQNSY